MIQQCVGVTLALLVAWAAPAAVARSDDRAQSRASVLGLRSLIGRKSAPTPNAVSRTQNTEELIVSYDSCCTAPERVRIEQACGATGCRTGYGSAFQVLSLARGRDAGAEAERLRRDPRVRFAEPNARVQALALAPDPYLSPYQWNLAAFGHGIHATAAWERSTGAGVVVAVLDTGIAYENYGGFLQAPDLAATQFVAGWDFFNNDAHANDDNGHGTHVAGIIAQSSNNGIGCAGVAPDATLMPIKVLGADGSGPTSAVADGIRYAADHGARVVNISLGTAQYSDAVREAVQYARGKGVVIVAAAGNDGAMNPVYPAAYEGVVSVGATRFDGQATYYSNHGPTVSVVAPGGDPKVDQNNDGFPDGILQQAFSRDRPGQFGFHFKVGTSQAAPHVAGVAALILSAHQNFTPDDVQTAIEQTATDLGEPGRDLRYGHGLVNAAAAVSFDPMDPAVSRPGIIDTSIDETPYNFEPGGFHGWNTTDYTRAGIFNSDEFAYRGHRSMRVLLKGINDFAPGILRAPPLGGAKIPVGGKATAYLRSTVGSLSARLVLYDDLGQPVVGPFVPLVPGRWLPVSVTAPSWARGPYRWIFIHFRGAGPSYSGFCYVDSIGW